MFELYTQEEYIADLEEIAREKGWAEGIAKGEFEKAIQVAKKMLAKNYASLEEIAKLTELPIQEIQKLAENM